MISLFNVRDVISGVEKQSNMFQWSQQKKYDKEPATSYGTNALKNTSKAERYTLWLLWEHKGIIILPTADKQIATVIMTTTDNHNMRNSRLSDPTHSCLFTDPTAKTERKTMSLSRDLALQRR
jgi:hypothetical protein